MATNNANLKAVLGEIGLSVLIGSFENERVDDETAVYLTDADLSRLGIETIGDRHRFRTKIKNHRARRDHDASSSAGQIMRQITESIHGQRNLFHPRGFGQVRPTKKQKTTRFTGWTATFYCLSSTSANSVPTSSEKEVLRKAGLGLKKIRLENTDTEETVLEKIMSPVKNDENEVVGFPQLQEAGGFELMRSSQNCRTLKVIGCKWNSKELKCNVGCQTRIYIRPIQNSLQLQPTVTETFDEGQCFGSCKICQKQFPMRKLRQHTDTCQNAESLPNEQILSLGPHYTETQYVPLDHLSMNETNDQYVAFGPSVIHNTTTTTGQIQIVNDSNDQFSAFAPSHLPHTITTVQTPDVSHVTTELFPYQTVTDTDIQHADQTDLPSLEQLLMPPTTTDSEVNEPRLSLGETVKEIVNFCKDKDINNPVEILKKIQRDIVTGRELEIVDVNSIIEGETNFIMVDRDNILQTGFDELENKTEADLRNTLEVQFYAEVAEDYGGPRKEFFKLMLMAIKEKYFDNGIRELLADDYRKIGIVFALSILQNGKMPCFMNEEVLNELWDTSKSPSPCIDNLRIGLNTLGMFELVTELPPLQFLFHKKTINLTVRKLTSVLQPIFGEAGSNRHTFEKTVYSKFVKYIREVASGRRGGITLPGILQFVTGADEEPVLGFTLQPTLEFCEVRESFIPTSNTCINKMVLPRPTSSVTLPTEEKLFELYDYAFSNHYYGLK